MNAVKRMVFNQVLVDKTQVDHLTAFLGIAVGHKKRKFRVTIQELKIPRFTKPKNRKALGCSDPAKDPVARFG